jgi:hypothetical protein
LTSYSNFKSTSRYGPSAEDIKRTYRIKSNIIRSQLHRQTGNPSVCYIAVPLPKPEERFMWIDLTYPVRAFMIPSAHTAHPQYTGHAIFSRLDVRGRKGLPAAYRLKGQYQKEIDELKNKIKKWDSYRPHNFRWVRQHNMLVAKHNKVWDRMKEAGPEGEAESEPGLKPDYRKPDGKVPSQVYARVPFDKSLTYEPYGWGLLPDWTVRIDVLELGHQLLIPWSRRTEEYRNIYACFALFDRRAVHGSPAIADFDMAQAIDLAQAQSAEQGVKLKYEADEPDEKFITDLLVGFVAVGLGLIPAVGPLVAFGWSIMYEVMTDTDKFIKAAGVGGKAPALTQALVDSRETFKPMMKAAGKSLFKLHQEQGDKRPIRIDAGEGNEQENSQQQSETDKNGDGNPAEGSEVGNEKVDLDSETVGQKDDSGPFRFIIPAGEVEVVDGKAK